MALRNTGQKGFDRLRERNVTTGNLTGVTKVNVDTDPDYIAPVYDPAYCEEGPLYITPEATTYNITSASSNVSVVIQSNTTWLGTNEPPAISFPFGNSGTHDGALNAAVTENTSSDPRTSSFTLRSTDNSVLISISIVQQGVPAPKPKPTPGLTEVDYGKAFNQSDACRTPFRGIYYINGPSIYEATNLYTDSAGTTKAGAGYYSDGEAVRYWTGSSFSGGAMFCTI